MMANFYSFIPALCRYLRTVEPKRILEWGPGESTKIMRQLCPEAEIISIEDSEYYYEEWKILNGGKVHLFHVPLKDGYSTFPLIIDGRFDLVFIDGKDDERADCLKTTFKILSENGVAILHDSEREWYQSAIALFKTIENEDGTIILKK